MLLIRYFISLSVAIFFIYSVNGQSPICSGAINNITVDKIEGETPFDPPPPPEPPIDTTNYRQIFWLHGLGGDKESWAKAVTATQNGAPNHVDWSRRDSTVLHYRPEYGPISIEIAGTEVYNFIRNQVITQDNGEVASNNFIIAHSQGGIVAREAARLMETTTSGPDKQFGGIVTFGTPHQGAMILNNADPNTKNMIGKFAERACVKLSAGPAEDKASNLPWYLEIFAHKIITKYLPEVCEIADQSIPMIFQDYSTSISEDYKVGSAKIEQLNNFPSTMKKVAFYGIEEEPVCWRTASSLIEEPVNSFDFFDANPDEKLLDKINDLHLNYIARRDFWDMKARQLKRKLPFLPCNGLDWFAFPRECLAFNWMYLLYKKRSKAFSEGEKWFHTANEEYKQIIGAIQIKRQTKLFCICYDEVTGTSTKTQINSPVECDRFPTPNEYCQLYPEESFSIHTESSDGVVLCSSAREYPNAIQKRMMNSNHQQMRNDENTKARLNELFDGGLSGFFFIEKWPL